MIKIGVTGGIGSGKTTVCRVFGVLGIPVYYADAEAKRLMSSSPSLIRQVIAAFGDGAYSNGGLNRSYLASRVFSDPLQLEKLNALVHPAVFNDFKAWCSRQQAPYVVKEAALLFESGSYRLCDHSILVTAPLALKLERVRLRDAMTDEEILERMARQYSDEQKLELAGFHIENDENKLVIPQVLHLHEQFMGRKGSDDRS